MWKCFLSPAELDQLSPPARAVFPCHVTSLFHIQGSRFSQIITSNHGSSVAQKLWGKSPGRQDVAEESLPHPQPGDIRHLPKPVSFSVIMGGCLTVG